ncbi:hypothetical protein PHYBOEH_007160 [Phytophthora boehmeriae]|uniref:Dynein heavy chain linker domain-containing protein n=1 Tax=Phytophthora boehmeriae TaxID=109152 RepID=A0A8T1WBI9_9STRA|nr:hypothetical protein PHYBOEH_007160 [Phytophthora boehmeriae]
MPGESAAGQDVATASTDGTHRRDERSRTSAAAFAQSPRYIDDVELEELRRQPPVAFVVQNSAAKEDETQTATAPAALEATAERKATTSRSWHSPVHVPLSHRKLVQSPAIFREDPPFRPIAPRLPVAAGRAGRRALGGKTRAGGTQKPTKLTPMPNAAVEFRDQLPNSVFVQMLREKNRDLFNRLVDRFAKLKRASVSEKGCDSNNGPNTTDTQVFGVEDAILFFLDAKHKRDVLYFKQKNPGGTKPSETAKLSLGLTSAPVSGGRYLPYDLERAEEMPRSSAGDFFMMTSATLVHYSNNSSDNNISGEVIPLSQWIMESKMFSLLLAGIPLFQKFLVRKVFLGWGRAIRQTIYRDNRKRIARSLPFARQAFASPLLQSCRVFHDIQDIRSLALPSDRPAMDLVEVQEHQKELLTAAETRLIDAKEELLNLMEKMVQSISDDLTPPTNMDELYSAEATSIHSINVKWKSTPITAVRHRKTGIQRQKATAALDMSLVEAYVRMMAYLFTESLYLMIIGCRAAITLEDRPQLIEFFCEQMRQVRLLKDGEKQLNQNIRNVDEVVRALKRFAPPLGSEVAPQYNVMHQFLNKYTSLSQSHAKFAAKVLPNITYQVNSALQKYSSRCQVLLRMYDEFSDMEEEKDMEKNVGTFQDIVRELKAIEKATKLYQEYQKMVGLKVVEVPSLAEAMAKWGEVQDLVTFTLQWLSTINSMENGIFGEQNWEVHAEKVHSFLPVIRELQSRGQAGFAESMLENIHQSVVDYLRKLSLVKEMAQPWVKLHHWKEILKLLNILNYASSIGVLITDGSTVTLGFLRSRDLWKYEIQILGITRKAHHDAMTERKLNAMKARLQDAALPILRIQDAYELDLPRASQLLESFEDDLLTIQSLAQITASGALQLQLVQWRDEVHLCEQVLDKWSIVQRSRTKLSMMFSLPDVQQSVVPIIRQKEIFGPVEQLTASGRTTLFK